VSGRVRAILLAALALAGCDSPFGLETPEPPRPGMELGAIALGVSSVPILSAPGFARAGEPIEVAFSTYGRGCVEERETEVAYVTARVQRVEVRPWEEVREGCAFVAQARHDHRVAVTFAVPGTATLALRGFDLDQQRVITVTHPVTVLPR
jgi:hypothetical protein